MGIVSTLCHGTCPPRAIWSMEGEAAQERRAAACGARVIDWLCVDFAEAMNDEKIISIQRLAAWPLRPFARPRLWGKGLSVGRRRVLVRGAPEDYDD